VWLLRFRKWCIRELSLLISLVWNLVFWSSKFTESQSACSHSRTRYNQERRISSEGVGVRMRTHLGFDKEQVSTSFASTLRSLLQTDGRSTIYLWREPLNHRRKYCGCRKDRPANLHGRNWDTEEKKFIYLVSLLRYRILLSLWRNLCWRDHDWQDQEAATVPRPGGPSQDNSATASASSASSASRAVTPDFGRSIRERGRPWEQQDLRPWEKSLSHASHRLSHRKRRIYGFE